MNEIELLAGFALGVGMQGAFTLALLSVTKGRGKSSDGWRPLPGPSRTAVLTKTVDELVGYTPVIRDPAAVVWDATQHMPRVQEAYSFNFANDDGTRRVLTIPAKYLSRFISMGDAEGNISRQDPNWRGQNDVYRDCLRVAISRQWVEGREGAKGYKWGADMRTLARRVRRLEEEAITLPRPD